MIVSLMCQNWWIVTSSSLSLCVPTVDMQVLTLELRCSPRLGYLIPYLTTGYAAKATSEGKAEQSVLSNIVSPCPDFVVESHA